MIKTTASLFVKFGSFRNDIGGIGAVEFALIAPALLMLYVAGVDLTLAITTHSKVQHSTAVVNDLITRQKAVKMADVQGVLRIANAIMSPRAKLDSIKVSALQIDVAGKAKVEWSSADGTSPDAKGSPVTLPSDFSGMKNVHLVKTETTFHYTPFGGFGLIDPINMGQVSYAYARVGDSVVCSDCN